jgi:TRAP-type mannitol/chloroaromatic compound transport system substrate-binding protein
MHRRSFMATAGVAAVGVVSTLPAPAVAQDIRELTMVTSWPKGSAGLGSSAERLATRITELSDGRLQVNVFGAGDLVDAFEVFDAVSAGIADMYHSAEYYWHAKSPAFSFFTAVPFGLTANELAAWIHRGGGQELWDALSAEYGLKSLLATNTGVQMAGWFTKEVTSVESYKGLRYRMPGLGGEVLKQLGGIVANLPGGEIVAALQSGAIDAAEWVGPWMDLDFGLYEGGKYYYYPGFHEPGTALCLGINKQIWDGLSASDKRLIEHAAGTEYMMSLADFNAENGVALATLINDHGVELRRFDDDVITELGRASRDVLDGIGNSDAATSRVYSSFLEQRKSLMDWSDISERAYLNARGLAFSGA